MRGFVALLLALGAFAPGLAEAQAGGSPSNAVGIWGVNPSTGVPCVVAPVGASGTPNCVLPQQPPSGGPPWSVAPIGNATTNGSTTLTTGAAAQNLFAGATPAHGYLVCDPNLTGDLWVSDTTAAVVNGGGSFRVQANGGCFVTPPNSQPLGAVSVIGPTTGMAITAREW